MSEFGKKILERLRDFTKKLERGEPIETTEVRRIQTPDGPMHVRTKKVLRVDRKTHRG